jgi:hypothetical protein
VDRGSAAGRRHVAWCRGEFRGARHSGYALALASDSGGRYLVLEPDGKVFALASFTGGAELSCYTPAQARQLNHTIAQSETIHGKVAPRWNTPVVCAFVEDTSAVCWQYSPAGRVFVEVGRWIT